MKWGALFYIAQYSTVPRKQDEDRDAEAGSTVLTTQACGLNEQ